MGGYRIEEEEKDEIFALFNKGYGVKEIEYLTGRSRTAIRKMMTHAFGTSRQLNPKQKLRPIVRIGMNPYLLAFISVFNGKTTGEKGRKYVIETGGRKISSYGNSNIRNGFLR